MLARADSDLCVLSDVHGTFMAIGVLLLLNHGSGILYRLNCDNVTLLNNLNGI